MSGFAFSLLMRHTGTDGILYLKRKGGGVQLLMSVVIMKDSLNTLDPIEEKTWK